MKSRPMGLEVTGKLIGGLASLFLSWSKGEVRKGATQPRNAGAHGEAELRKMLGVSMADVCVHLGHVCAGQKWNTEKK